MANPPIEAEQTEPLKRNLNLPHKPPAKKKLTIAKVDTASIFSRSIAYYNYYYYTNSEILIWQFCNHSPNLIPRQNSAYTVCAPMHCLCDYQKSYITVAPSHMDFKKCHVTRFVKTQHYCVFLNSLLLAKYIIIYLAKCIL